MPLTYQDVRDYIKEQLARRSELPPGPFVPSQFWEFAALRLRYVRTLPDEELQYLRYHTYYMNGDIYLRYLYQDNLIAPLVTQYEEMSKDLDGFRPHELANGFGFKTPYGIVGLDVLRYMVPLRDLYKAGILSRTVKQTVLEIGGGYGGVARLALEFNPKLAYVLSDLEETLFFQGIYLLQALGSERLHLLEGTERFPNGFEPGHVYLLAQHKSDWLRTQAFDIAINQQSMQEMTLEQVEHYCDLLDRTTAYFYSCNMNEHPNVHGDSIPTIRGLSGYLASRFEVVSSNVPPGAPSVPKDQWPADRLIDDVIFNRTVYRTQRGARLRQSQA